jgi:hypothetical protein
MKSNQQTFVKCKFRLLVELLQRNFDQKMLISLSFFSISTQSQVWANNRFSLFSLSSFHFSPPQAVFPIAKKERRCF